MTPEERNTVIEALEIGLENTRLSQSEPILRALAIMRREGEETTVQHVHKWFKTGSMEPGLIRCIECGLWGKED